MKKIVNIRKAISGLAMTLALSMAMTGCSFGGRTNTNSNSSRNESSYEVQTDDIIDDIQEHVHEHENEIDPIAPEIDKEAEESISEIPDEIKEEAERKRIVKDDNKEVKPGNAAIIIDENTIYDANGNLVIPDLSVQFISQKYTENSIIKALKLAGYNSSYEYRALLAAHFGIENYRGTAAQNVLLLDYLRHPEYFLGQNDLSHNDGDNGVTQDNTQSNDQTDIKDDGKGNGNGNGNGNGTNGGGSENEDKEETGRWILISSRATGYSEIANDDNYHYTTYTDTYINTKTGSTKRETRTVREAHNYVDDSCKNCGHVKTKEQDKHNLTGSISKSYRDNGDSGHTVTETQYCTTHNTYETIGSYSEAHTPGDWKVNPDNPDEEIQVCTKGDCGHIIARRPIQKEEHNRTGEIRKTYEDKDSTNHTVTEKQYCDIHGEWEVVKTYEEAHTPGDWKVNPDNPDEEIQVCTKAGCNHIIARRPVQTEEHKYTGEIRKEYEEKDKSVHTVNQYQYCETHGKEEFIGSYEEAHSLGDWETDPLDPTKEIQVCKNCGEVVNVRDKKEECKHEHTHQTEVIEYVDANGHKKTITIICDDCKEPVGEPIVENGTHTPSSTRTEVQQGTADESGHYIVVTNIYDCCGEHALDATYVAHGNEGYTQVGDTTYKQVSQNGVDGHIEVTTYKYNDCGFEFVDEKEFTPCTNVDGKCPHCGREMSHSHDMHWEPITLTEEEEKLYCSKGANVCSIEGCNHREEPVYVMHGENGYARDYQDSGDWDYIICATEGCGHIVDKVERAEVYDGEYGHFEANPKAFPPATEVDPWATFTISSSTVANELAAAESVGNKLQQGNENKQGEEVKTGEVKTETQQGKEVKTETGKVEEGKAGENVVVEGEGKQQEIVIEKEKTEETSEKEVEKTPAELYNEYTETVDSYLNTIGSSEGEELEQQSSEKALSLTQ